MTRRSVEEKVKDEIAGVIEQNIYHCVDCLGPSVKDYASQLADDIYAHIRDLIE